MDKSHQIKEMRIVINNWKERAERAETELERLRALAAEPWGYTSGIRHPELDGAVVRDQQGINQFPVYLAPPAPVVKVPDEATAENFNEWFSGRALSAAIQGANWMLAEVLRLNDNSAPATDNTEEQYHSISREKRNG